MSERDELIGRPLPPPTPEALPQPKVTPAPKWPLLAWLVPVAAVVVAAGYYRMSAQQRGPEITVVFDDATGLRANETQVTHRGVRIGTVRGMELTDDQGAAKVRIQLRQDAAVFAKEGAEYWVVRPQISWENVSGLSTLVGGPYVEVTPGSGAAREKFTGLKQAPEATFEGLQITLHADRVERVQTGTPVAYRGIDIGNVTAVVLSNDARGVDVKVTVRKPFVSLVRKNSRFWMVKGADVKGGIFSGVEVKLESVRTILGGQVAMATPTELGPLAVDGDGFSLAEEPEGKWLEWAPVIAIETPPTQGTAKMGVEAGTDLAKPQRTFGVP